MKKYFSNWISLLQRETRGAESILDLGCGNNSPVQFLPIPQKVGVDAYAPYIENKSIHSQYILDDIRTVRFPRKSFDIVLASEVIEHLEKYEGLLLLDRIEEFASKKVIVTTPNGFVQQESFDGNGKQEHKSGWTVSDFRQRGYRVYGMSGCKCFRNKHGKLLFHNYPYVLMADVSQVVCRYFPSVAFQLFAVKNI